MALPRPAIEQIWTMSTKMGQIMQQIEQLNLDATQQTADPAIRANIQYFANQAAMTRESVCSLLMEADGLMAYMQTITPVIIVPPHLPPSF